MLFCGRVSSPVTGCGYVNGVTIMSLFRHYHDSFNPETLAILQSVLDETWTALKANRKAFDEMKTRTAIADLGKGVPLSTS